jgi:hypothetical protein
MTRTLGKSLIAGLSAPAIPTMPKSQIANRQSKIAILRLASRARFDTLAH